MQLWPNVPLIFYLQSTTPLTLDATYQLVNRPTQTGLDTVPSVKFRELRTAFVRCYIGATLLMRCQNDKVKHLHLNSFQVQISSIVDFFKLEALHISRLSPKVLLLLCVLFGHTMSSLWQEMQPAWELVGSCVPKNHARLPMLLPGLGSSSVTFPPLPTSALLTSSLQPGRTFRGLTERWAYGGPHHSWPHSGRTEGKKQKND